jgi:hypothetical protein
MAGRLQVRSKERPRRRKQRIKKCHLSGVLLSGFVKPLDLCLDLVQGLVDFHVDKCTREATEDAFHVGDSELNPVASGEEGGI